MSRTYAKAVLPNNGGDVYNAIITSTPSLKNAGLPFAATSNYPDGTANSREIGKLLYNDINLSNQFIPALLNGIAVRVLLSKYWEDPWVSLEKGKINYGEFVEEVFINMAKPHQFDQKRAEEEVFKRDIPNVMTAFHSLNYQKFYKQSISNEELRMAFDSWEGLTRFIADIIQNMFKSANYDVNQTKRYLIARAALQGFIKAEEVNPVIDKASAEDAVAAARTVSLNMLELNSDSNYYNVPNDTQFEDQVIIINNAVAGRIDVSVLAADFNMDKAEFLTMHRLAVSSFGNLDMPRLRELFGKDQSFVDLTESDLAMLNTIPFIIFDKSWFQIYDFFNGVTNIFNSDGLYWNYDYHVWKIFGVSPFANARMFTNTPPEVVSVTISPTAVTVSPGQCAQFMAEVETKGFQNKLVVWSTDNDTVTIGSNGLLTVPGNIATGTTINVTATATADSTKSGSAVLTVG